MWAAGPAALIMLQPDLGTVLIIGSIVIGMIVCAIFYMPLFAFLLEPWATATELLEGMRPNLEVQAVLSGVTAPLILVLMV